jgi:hypothetical protein
LWMGHWLWLTIPRQLMNGWKWLNLSFHQSE